MTKIYLMRHCQAEGNLTRVFHGQYDGDITELGAKQLECLSERFKNIYIDKIYSSPLKRAYKTAEAINKYKCLPIIKKDNLMEINAGVIEKCKWADMPSRFPEDNYNWINAPHLFAPAGGESMSEVRERAIKATLQIADESDGLTVAVAAHACLIRNIICVAKGLEIEELLNVKWCENTSVNTIEVENGKIKLIKENDFRHLPFELTRAGWGKGIIKY